MTTENTLFFRRIASDDQLIATFLGFQVGVGMAVCLGTGVAVAGLVPQVYAPLPPLMSQQKGRPHHVVLPERLSISE